MKNEGYVKQRLVPYKIKIHAANFVYYMDAASITQLNT